MAPIAFETGLATLHETTRACCREDFVFFVNTVLGSGMDERMLERVQDCVVSRKAAVFTSSRSRTLATALMAWLAIRGEGGGIEGLLTAHETLRWLFSDIVAPTYVPTFEVSYDASAVELRLL